MIFEKIRERLQNALSNVNVNRITDNIIKDKPKKLGQIMAYNRALDIINQVEAEYTCENCVEKGRCSIYDNTDVKYCADCRPLSKSYKEDDTEGFLNTMQLAEDWNLEITEEQRERLNSLKDRW